MVLVKSWQPKIHYQITAQFPCEKFHLKFHPEFHPRLKTKIHPKFHLVDDGAIFPKELEHGRITL